MTLPPQLLKECHHLGELYHTQLLLNRNAALHWFIVVPVTELHDVLDLPEAELSAVLRDCSAVSTFLKQELGYHKVNFAGLGNVVQDMHLHIIGRRDTDVCWPQPIWGNLPEGDVYTGQQVAQLTQKLRAQLGLRPAPA